MMKLALGALLIGLVACGGEGRNNNVIILDTSIDTAPATCNPLTQTGCATGEKCANRTLQGQPNEINEIACVPDGTVGELCLRSSAMMRGYWHDEEETARRPAPVLAPAESPAAR